MTTSLPQSTFNPTSLPTLGAELGSTVRAVEAALNERLSGRVALVQRYIAKGSPTQRIPLLYTTRLGSEPLAVLLVSARETKEPSKDVGATTRLGFTRERDTVYAFEPLGLTASQTYDLTFLILET